MRRLHLTPDEAALIAWITAWLVDVPDHETEDEQHPVQVLARLHSREELHQAAKALESNFNGPGFCWIETPIGSVMADILRVCVERNDYHQFLADNGHEDLASESEAALRSLAYKLDEAGVEISTLPSLRDRGPRWS